MNADGGLSGPLPLPSLEQAAEMIPIPLLWRGARQGGVVERPHLKNLSSLAQARLRPPISRPFADE